MAVIAPTRQQQIWRAQPRQEAFLRRDEDEVLYGGAAGGGKSDALIIWLIVRAQQFAGSRGIYFRRTFADLARADAALDRSKVLLSGIAKYDEQDHRWTLPFGAGTPATIDFGYLEHENDKYRYQSAQYGSMAFDELTQFYESQYLYMLSRNRTTIRGMRSLVRSGANPGGVGHDWVKRRFIDGKQPGVPFALPKAPGQVKTRYGCFIPAKLQDNQVLMELDPDYWERLLALPETEREALAYGNWNIFEGQFFKEWSPERHVCKPFKIPANWTRWTATDYGFADPFCTLWFARNPADRYHVYIYREAYGAGLRDEEQARAIVKASHGERVVVAVGDPSMFNKRSEQNKPSIASVYAKNGVKLVPGVNERIAGWQCVRRAMAWRDSGVDPVSGEMLTEIKPRLQVFEGMCPNLVRTIPAMLHDPLDTEDLADKIKSVKTEDHAVDPLRYGLMLESMPDKQQRKLLSFEVLA